MQSPPDQIPPPQQQPQPQGASDQTSQTTPAVQIPISLTPGEARGLGGNDVIIGIGISLVLAAIFWFVGRVVTDTLVKQFAEVGASKRAGLMLFLLLTVMGAFATFGFLGNFWLATYFLIPAASLSALMLIVFLFSLVAANRTKRR
jgi:hypothetical protein